MSGVTLSVSIQDQAVRRLFEKLSQRTGNLRPALMSMGEYMVRRTFERFGKEQDPWGRPWRTLSKRTLERKKPGLKILQGTTSLLRDTNVYKLVGGSSVEIGNNRIYGAIQQLGGKAGRGHKVTIPARPYLGVNDRDEKEFEAILTDYLTSL